MRNKDSRLLFFLFGAIAFIESAAGFLISTKTGLLLLGQAAALGAAAAVVQKYRHKRIADLSLELDKLLHGNYDVDFSCYSEGELAILQNELTKVTITLKEQAGRLQDEKVRLADSIADISHQIRTPLTALNLNLSFLGTEECLPKERKEKLMQARMLVKRMEWLIEALLKLSKLDAGTIIFANESVDIIELFQKAAKPFEILLDLHGQTLNVSKIPKQCRFMGDFSWSVEAVSNVLKNCIEHAGEGSMIWVSAGENAIYTEILIEDNGPGIAVEDLPHLFERFYKGKNSSSQSVGIGLALSRAILVRENGIIQAENRREGGARFNIRIYKGIL